MTRVSLLKCSSTRSRKLTSMINGKPASLLETRQKCSEHLVTNGNANENVEISRHSFDDTPNQWRSATECRPMRKFEIRGNSGNAAPSAVAGMERHPENIHKTRNAARCGPHLPLASRYASASNDPGLLIRILERLSTLIIMALSKLDKLFTYDSLVHAVSGAAGAVVAMTAFYPLDTVRSRLQIEEDGVPKSTVEMLQKILDEEGLQGLYRGLTPVLQSLVCSNFVYFYSFHGLRAVLDKGKNHSAGSDLALAAVAGTINVLATTPMWVVNTRMKMSGVKNGPNNPQCGFKSISEGLVHIARTEGLSALWSSTLPSLILVSNPSIQFMVYEALKRRCTRLGVPLSSGTIFTIGAVAKCVATVLTYPIQLAQSKMRYSNDNKRSMISVLIYVVRNFGFGGLFRGLESKLLQTVSTTALMFMAYEKIAEVVFTLLKAESKKKVQ